MTRKRVLPDGIYAITAEEFSKGRKNTDVAREILSSGVKILQYREKENKTLREKYLECREIAKMCRDFGATFIVNDHIDIALLCDADGIHIGQDDLPLPEARKLVGDKIIGLSTHSIAQAREAVSLGADYIGVGPIFTTNTKKNVVNAVGLSYLQEVVKEIELDFVAIGGIKEHNIDKVIQNGSKTVALVTEIVGASDIAETIKRLSKHFHF